MAKQTSLFEQGLTAGRTIDIEITGPDLQRLVAIGGQIMGQVRGVLPTRSGATGPQSGFVFARNCTSLQNLSRPPIWGSTALIWATR